MTTNSNDVPMHWRVAVGGMFVGGALVVMGGLLTLLFLQTTPVTYVSQIHKGAIESVAKAPPYDASR